MQVVRSLDELNSVLEVVWAAAVRIGFVPTMGALHEGHLSLTRLCGPCDYRVVSIFVNPTQFAPNEDLSRYPRTLDEDLAMLSRENIDLVYVPSVEDMYGSGVQISIQPGEMGKVFEGAIRPEHFAGVLTVVGKLFHRVKPDVAVFGEKDFQQLCLIRKMVKELDWPVQILGGKTIRESDGLAMSSRNRFLKQSERASALALSRALRRGQEAAIRGVKSTEELRGEMMQAVREFPAATVDYLTAIEPESYAEPLEFSATSRLIGAIRVGSVRLIDNMPICE
ncbi:pantoate--beta-alanine ligase [bacterium]|nr:pantoate--beta-alanine ligase [bacterium]